MQTFPSGTMIHWDYINNSEAAPHTQPHCVSVNANTLAISDSRESIQPASDLHEPALEPWIWIPIAALCNQTLIKTIFVLSDGWDRNLILASHCRDSLSFFSLLLDSFCVVDGRIAAQRWWRGCADFYGGQTWLMPVWGRIIRGWPLFRAVIVLLMGSRGSAAGL